VTVDHHHEAVARREEIARAGRAKGDHYKRISGRSVLVLINYI
jgi:hypothetical protein